MFKGSDLKNRLYQIQQVVFSFTLFFAVKKYRTHTHTQTRTHTFTRARVLLSVSPDFYHFD